MHTSFLSHSHFFFSTAPATTEIYTLSLHDALPISMRAPGHPQASFAMESLMDELAYKIGMDPSKIDRKSTRLNSSHVAISYAVFCLKKKKNKTKPPTTSIKRTTNRPRHHPPTTHLI